MLIMFDETRNFHRQVACQTELERDLCRLAGAVCSNVLVTADERTRLLAAIDHLRAHIVSETCAALAEMQWRNN